MSIHLSRHGDELALDANKDCMKRFLIACLVLFFSVSYAADNVEVRWRLRLVGDPAAPLNQDWFFFGSEAECDAAVRSGNYGDIPSVKALGKNAWFDCVHMIRALPSAPAVVATNFTPACAGFYSSPFTLSSTRTVDVVPSVVKPGKGTAFPEPSYKTCELRAADHSADGVPGMAITDYSRRQAFNADGSKYLIYGNDGSWHAYDSKTYIRIKQLAMVGGGDVEPQWNETDPDKLFFLPTDGIGMKLSELTVSTNASTVVADFSARLKAKWPTANAAWTRSEGSPSKDGRFWCFQVDDSNWSSLGVFTWDRSTDTITGTLSTNGDRPDHVSMSPSGNHCVVSWTSTKGTVSFSRDFSTQLKVHTTSEHSDLAVMANGDDAYVSIDYQSQSGDMFMVDLETGVRTVLLPTYLSGSATAMHISGKAFNHPGWVVMDAYSGQAPKQWFHDKVLAVQLQANPKIYNLAFHRSFPNGYYTEPHATVNRDFTRVMFNSNWGVNSATDLDAYMVELPADVIN